jgi:hypothetical protein
MSKYTSVHHPYITISYYSKPFPFIRPLFIIYQSYNGQITLSLRRVRFMFDLLRLVS